MKGFTNAPGKREYIQCNNSNNNRGDNYHITTQLLTNIKHSLPAKQWILNNLVYFSVSFNYFNNSVPKVSDDKIKE